MNRARYGAMPLEGARTSPRSTARGFLRRLIATAYAVAATYDAVSRDRERAFSAPFAREAAKELGSLGGAAFSGIRPPTDCPPTTGRPTPDRDSFCPDRSA